MTVIVMTQKMELMAQDAAKFGIALTFIELAGETVMEGIFNDMADEMMDDWATERFDDYDDYYDDDPYTQIEADSVYWDAIDEWMDEYDYEAEEAEIKAMIASDEKKEDVLWMLQDKLERKQWKIKL